MPALPVIQTQSLGCRFGNTVAVDDLTLEVRSGEVFGFLGHNGAGKTTTIRLLNGVLAPSSGSARVFGLDPRTDGPALRSRTGVLTETPGLDERLTARENLTFFAHVYGVPEPRVASRVASLLDTFDLARRADDRVGGFSKGMRQRLALARMLVHEPELLFLDEPTAGLDPVATRQLHELLRQASRDGGRTVFLCTHNLIEAQALCDRVAVLAHGRLLAVGTPAELARQLGGLQRIGVEVDRGQGNAAAAIMRSLDGVVEVAVLGDVLHVAGLARERIPAMVASLVGAGIGVYRVQPHDPSLEDVYFALQPAAAGSAGRGAMEAR